MDDRLIGAVVKWFPQPRGYGFVEVPSSSVWFFCHFSDVVPGRQDLRVGARVSFTLGRDGRGRVKAVDVALTDAPIQTGATAVDH